MLDDKERGLSEPHSASFSHCLKNIDLGVCSFHSIFCNRLESLAAPTIYRCGVGCSPNAQRSAIRVPRIRKAAGFACRHLGANMCVLRASNGVPTRSLPSWPTDLPGQRTPAVGARARAAARVNTTRTPHSRAPPIPRHHPHHPHHPSFTDIPSNTAQDARARMRTGTAPSRLKSPKKP